MNIQTKIFLSAFESLWQFSGLSGEGAWMQTLSSKVTSKGQIVIPKKIREKYGIRPSTSIRWIEKEEGILMIPDSEDPIAAARGMLKGCGILKAYLKDKKREKEKEDRKGHAR